jgi:DnaJ-class molecular chaperone
MSSGYHMLDELKAKAKDNFKALAMKHHPDKGGSHEAYVNIQQAYETVKTATTAGFVDALKFETKYYTSGAAECATCSKWSDVVRACVTASCTGFKERGANALLGKVQNWRRQGTNPKNSGFFSGRGEGLERTTG